MMVVEVMGRYAGWLALHAGVAGGADVILIPEIPYDLDEGLRVRDSRDPAGQAIHHHRRVRRGQAQGRRRWSSSSASRPAPTRSAWAASPTSWSPTSSARPDLDCRAIVLGHIQRGGTPTPHDRVLATMFGHHALELLVSGVKNRLVVWKNGGLSSVPLASVAGKTRTVPRNHPPDPGGQGRRHVLRVKPDGSRQGRMCRPYERSFGSESVALARRRPAGRVPFARSQLAFSLLHVPVAERDSSARVSRSRQA